MAPARQGSPLRLCCVLRLDDPHVPSVAGHNAMLEAFECMLELLGPGDMVGICSIA
jgi:hypothetical protein